jgi:alpha-glucosidase (family GH31 glycosyl hydrolase)
MAMDFRYSLLKYIYNVFVQRDGKGVVYYPMVFDFPDNYDILSESRYIENQVMIGPNMMFSSKD